MLFFQNGHREAERTACLICLWVHNLEQQMSQSVPYGTVLFSFPRWIWCSELRTLDMYLWSNIWNIRNHPFLGIRKEEWSALTTAASSLLLLAGLLTSHQKLTARIHWPREPANTDHSTAHLQDKTHRSHGRHEIKAESGQWCVFAPPLITSYCAANFENKNLISEAVGRIRFSVLMFGISLILVIPVLDIRLLEKRSKARGRSANFDSKFKSDRSELKIRINYCVLVK